MSDGAWIIWWSTFIFCVGLALGHRTTDFYYRLNAIERGYGLYCPANGDFAWKGECRE
jgi:hypothetical protein